MSAWQQVFVVGPDDHQRKVMVARCNLDLMMAPRGGAGRTGWIRHLRPESRD